MLRMDFAMRDFNKILFPLDLSEVFPTIARYGCEMAAKFDAEIHFLFVARILGHFISIHMPHPSVNRFEAEIVKGAEKKLPEFTKAYFKDKFCQANIVLGELPKKSYTTFRPKALTSYSRVLMKEGARTHTFRKCR